MSEWRNFHDIDDLKEHVADMMAEHTRHSEHPIDDYGQYDYPGREPFDPIYGSLVRAMTPDGEVFVFEVKEMRRGDGYCVSRIGEGGWFE